MNLAAHRLGIDPSEVRRKNFLHKGDRMPTGQVIQEEIALDILMDRALALSDYKRKKKTFELDNTEGKTPRRGIGLAIFYHGCGFTGGGEVRIASEVTVGLTKSGGVEIFA